MLNGIDISNFNTGIDPASIPGDFVIMRASEGKGMRDAYFAGYDAKVRPSSKLAGAYHFMWIGSGGKVINTPQSEAENFTRAVENHLRPGFLLVADFEPAGALARETGWAVDFAHEVKRLTGRTPLLYANRSTLNDGLWARWRLEINTAYWLAGGTAQYAQRTDGYVNRGLPSNPNGWGSPAMHQFTEHGYLPGWAKRLDLNEFYGDAARWRLLADGKATEAPMINIPTIRENDPPVNLVNSRGEILRSSNGSPRKACACMALTFPLIEREMIRQGLIKHSIDVFQGGYNKGVAASAGTHDMGGVIDVAQGITQAQRQIWADHGVMMFPRTRQYGWSGGEHGHGVWHGCNHRTASAAAQVRSGLNGYDGLVGNAYRNFIKPSRTWQDAVRAMSATSKPSVPVKTPAKGASMATYFRTCDVNSDGATYARAMPEIFPDSPDVHYQTVCYIDAPEGTSITARLVEYRHGQGDQSWHRHPEVTFNAVAGQPTIGQLVHNGRTEQGGVQVWVDIKTDKPDPVHVRAYTHTVEA